VRRARTARTRIVPRAMSVRLLFWANKQDPIDFYASTRTVITLHVPSGMRTRMGTLSLHQLLPPPKTPRTRLNRLGVGDQDLRPGSDKEAGDGDGEVVMSGKNLLDGAPGD
jgi:hypothetical protein